jgi:hypothetical protein
MICGTRMYEVLTRMCVEPSKDLLVPGFLPIKVDGCSTTPGVIYTLTHIASAHLNTADEPTVFREFFNICG